MLSQRIGLAICLVGYVLFTLAWNVSTPALESPDETGHLEYAQFLARHGRLPNLNVDHAGYEAHHPPLYHALLGAVMRVFDAPYINVYPQVNPVGFRSGGPLRSRQFLPIPGKQATWVRLLRLVSLPAGIVTVLATYGIAKVLTQSPHTSLLAASHTAFLPQFTFISASVSNDALVTALASLSFLLMIHIATEDRIHPKKYLVLGLLISLAILTKHSALALLPLAFIVVTVKARSPRRLTRNIAILALVCFIVAGWYLLRNFALYGDPLGTGIQRAILSELIAEKSLRSPYFLDAFPQLLFRSFFGMFGSMNLALPETVYRVYFLIVLVSLMVLILSIVRGRRERLLGWAILFSAPLLLLGAVVYYNLTYSQPQGRFLFPALVPFSTLVGAGAASSSHRVGRIGAQVGMVLFLIAANLQSLWFVMQVYGG